MRVRFWGVRGSVPWATPSGMRHGCNTPCVELRDDSGDVLLLDAGSGSVGFSESLTGPPGRVAILLTHYHWDHVQGLPFCTPFYLPGWSPELWMPVLSAGSAPVIGTIFDPPFFPVSFDRLPNRPSLQPMTAGPIAIGSFRVRSLRVNHPGGALAYRVSGSAGDLVYVPDHEMGDAHYDEPLAAFVAGARVVILDSHFTPDEAAAHRGWGHSTWADAARFGAALGIERLYLFHHRPGRSDEDLDGIQAQAQEVCATCRAAAEGETFDV